MLKNLINPKDVLKEVLKEDRENLEEDGDQKKINK